MERRANRVVRAVALRLARRAPTPTLARAPAETTRPVARSIAPDASTRMLARGSRGLTAKGLAWYTLGAPRRPNPDVRSLRAFARLSRARGAAGDLSARASPASDLSSSSARRARDFVAPAVPSRFRGAAVSGLDRGVDDASAQQPARARPLAPRVAEFPSARAHGALDPWRAPRDAPDAAAAHIAAVAAPTSSPYTHYDARLARAPPPDDPPPPPPPPDDPPPDEEKRLYHFQVRGADAKRAMDPEKIRCMCHEVAVAAATRARNVHVRAAVVEAGAASNPARPDPDSLLDDFCVFSHTVMVRERARASFVTHRGANENERRRKNTPRRRRRASNPRRSAVDARAHRRRRAETRPDAPRPSRPPPLGFPSSARHPRREAQQAQFLGRHALVQLVRHGG